MFEGMKMYAVIQIRTTDSRPGSHGKIEREIVYLGTDEKYAKFIMKNTADFWKGSIDKKDRPVFHFMAGEITEIVES